MADKLGNELRFTKTPGMPHSTRQAWNVDLNGRPYGQIWTFKAKGEKHPFHLKTLSGYYRTFRTFKAAEEHVIHLAG